MGVGCVVKDLEQWTCRAADDFVDISGYEEQADKEDETSDWGTISGSAICRGR